jgi:hypothetical protein
MPHNPATRSPSCSGQTAHRPRPPHQHSGPPPRPKSQLPPPPLRQCWPGRQPRRTSDTRQSPKSCKQLLRLMKHLPIWIPRPPPQRTNLDPRGVPRNSRKLTLQGDTPKREAAKTPSSCKLDNQNLGFHPERPSWSCGYRKRSSPTMPQERKRHPEGAAVIGIDPQV